MKKIILSAVILTLISACAGIGGATKQVDPIAIENADTFTGQNKVLLGDFRVTFITFDKTSATAKSSMFSSDTGYATSGMRATLKGVPVSAQQEDKSDASNTAFSLTIEEQDGGDEQII